MPLFVVLVLLLLLLLVWLWMVGACGVVATGNAGVVVACCMLFF